MRQWSIECEPVMVAWFVSRAKDPAYADVMESMRDALRVLIRDDVSPEKRSHHNVNFYTSEKHGKQSGPPELVLC